MTDYWETELPPSERQEMYRTCRQCSPAYARTQDAMEEGASDNDPDLYDEARKVMNDWHEWWGNTDWSEVGREY